MVGRGVCLSAVTPASICACHGWTSPQHLAMAAWHLGHRVIGQLHSSARPCGGLVPKPDAGDPLLGFLVMPKSMLSAGEVGVWWSVRVGSS